MPGWRAGDQILLSGRPGRGISIRAAAPQLEISGTTFLPLLGRIKGNSLSLASLEISKELSAVLCDANYFSVDQKCIRGAMFYSAVKKGNGQRLREWGCTSRNL